MNAVESDNGVPIDGAAVEDMPVEAPRRAASVTLRPDDVRQARAATLEAANKSLADALSIIYRLLQLLMVGLAALFLLSGFQQVNESEAGIKVQFGAATDKNVAPGFVPSLPYPLGEVIKVETAQVNLDVDQAFWPDVGQANLGKPLTSGGRFALSVENDGSMITADGNLVHTQWSVKYRRANPYDYVRNIHVAPDGRSQERAIVAAALQRAAVHVIAQTTVDELLKGAVGGPGDGGFNLIERRTQELTQETLDRLEVGLVVDSVVLKQKSPPQRTIDAFERVNNAVSEGAEAVEAASGAYTERLTAVAGAAGEPLLALIDLYGSQRDLGDPAADDTLDLIRQVLDGEFNGRAIEVDGQVFDRVSMAGSASNLIENAKLAADTFAESARSIADDFDAVFANYRQGPEVFVERLWAKAKLDLVDRAVNQVFVLPGGASGLRLLVNQDPSVLDQIGEAVERAKLVEDKSYARGMFREDLIRPEQFEEDR